MLQRIADGRTDLVFEFLAGGHPWTARDDRGNSLIEWCAYHGDVTSIRFLLSKGAGLESLGSNLGLSGAAFHGYWQLTQFLLEQGADPNFADADTGETPLHAATTKANRPDYDLVVEVLLAHGADPTLRTRPGAESSAFMRDVRTVGETPLHRAAAFATEHTVVLLLEAGAEREARDSHGDSPLSWASRHLRPAAILRLLCFGNFRVHPDNHSQYDHGRGWGQRRGRPHL